jgi:hypothetical protein
MKNQPLPPPVLALLATATFALTHCNRSEKNPDIPAETSISSATEVAPDAPILPVHPGDSWHYDVHIEIQAGVMGPDAPAVDTHQERIRKYLGKVVVAEGLPESECFEVVSPGSPKEREFVEIHHDRILLRGSLTIGAKTTKPVWLDPPILFVSSEMKAGSVIPEIHDKSQFRKRKTQVVAREDITVPAGKFNSIRMLMTGSDGPVELRRTIWFSPGVGIIREEKVRYANEKLLFRETHELVGTTLKH